MHQSFVGWAFDPDPTGGVYNAPPDPLGGLLLKEGEEFWKRGGEGVRRKKKHKVGAYTLVDCCRQQRYRHTLYTQNKNSVQDTTLEKHILLTSIQPGV